MTVTSPIPVPLSIISAHYGFSTGTAQAQVAIGKQHFAQQTPSGQGQYWFLVIDRSNLNVVYNQMQAAWDQAPPIQQFNNPNYILVVATLAVGFNHQPQGALFKFLDLNGAGRQLRRIDQLAQQFGCGSLGTFGYALVSVLGDLNQPGYELSDVNGPAWAPILTVQLMPFQVSGGVLYTPVELSNA